MSKEPEMTPEEVFDSLVKATEYLNGMKAMLTNNGWTEENAQMIIIHFLAGSVG